MRTEKAIYNLIANLVLQIVTAICGFILPALFIRYYGSEVNGMIGSIKQFIAYLSLVEGGVGAASVAALYSPLVKQNSKAINAILSATHIFYKKSGYIFVAFLILITAFYPWLVRNEIGFSTSLVMVVIIGCGGLIEYFFIGQYRVLLTADQKNYVISFIQATATALNALAIFFLIIAGTNLLLVQTAATLIYVSRFFVIRYYVKAHYPHVTFKSEPDFTAIANRWSAFIHQIATIIVFNSPIVIITIFCGLKAVSIYVVYNMVFAAVGMMVGVFSNGLRAGFGELIAAQEHELLKSAYTNYEYIYYGALAWAYTCTGLLIMPFIKVYSANFTDANYIHPDIAILFLIIGVANNLRIPPNTVLFAAGHFRETQRQAILEAAINLTASLIFVQFWGVTGVLLGSVCSYAYRTLDIILYSAKYIIRQSPLGSIKRIMINFLLALVAAAPFVFWLPIETANYRDWLIWAIGMSIYVLVVIMLGNILTDLAMFKATWSRVKSII
ncbi:MAG: polysaccharide biosynthesis C-terminal domain-containing protein [Syntrophomonadaceae bacterium]